MECALPECFLLSLDWRQLWMIWGIYPSLKVLLGKRQQVEAGLLPPIHSRRTQSGSTARAASGWSDIRELEGGGCSMTHARFYFPLSSSPSSCPPSALVKEVLSSVQRLTFYGFLMALAKHHGINRALGALPDKGDLLLDPPMDQELEKLLSQVSGLSISTPAGSSGDIANLPTRTSPRISSPWKPLHHRQKVNTESDGSTDETESSEN
uniref:Centriolar satellite-associated tubulin polyglutamylase complex regulator 1 n=1 Tax=Terrapene triunguis TaxID=2587831 RepID=A0A674I194_9SAUR